MSTPTWDAFSRDTSLALRTAAANLAEDSHASSERRGGDGLEEPERHLRSTGAGSS
jgi:hypothetical protein